MYFADIMYYLLRALGTPCCV